MLASKVRFQGRKERECRDAWEEANYKKNNKESGVTREKKDRESIFSILSHLGALGSGPRSKPVALRLLSLRLGGESDLDRDRDRDLLLYLSLGSLSLSLYRSLLSLSLSLSLL